MVADTLTQNAPAAGDILNRLKELDALASQPRRRSLLRRSTTAEPSPLQRVTQAFEKISAGAGALLTREEADLLTGRTASDHQALQALATHNSDLPHMIEGFVSKNLEAVQSVYRLQSDAETVLAKRPEGTILESLSLENPLRRACNILLEIKEKGLSELKQRDAIFLKTMGDKGDNSLPPLFSSALQQFAQTHANGIDLIAQGRGRWESAGWLRH